MVNAICFVTLPIVNYNNILINTVAKPHFMCSVLIRSLTCGQGERPMPHKSDSNIYMWFHSLGYLHTITNPLKT